MKIFANDFPPPPCWVGKNTFMNEFYISLLFLAPNVLKLPSKKYRKYFWKNYS